MNELLFTVKLLMSYYRVTIRFYTIELLSGFILLSYYRATFGFYTIEVLYYRATIGLYTVSKCPRIMLHMLNTTYLIPLKQELSD